MDYRKEVPPRFTNIGSLSNEDARREIDALRDAIHYHDRRYYVENNPRISDAAYDRLFHRLEQLEEKYPSLKAPNSPTSRVGAEPVSKLKKRRHTVPMQSLKAAIERREIESYDSTIQQAAHDGPVEYMAEIKFDGLSVELVYHDGELEYAATRGNGETGEDISRNVRTMKAVALKVGDGRAVPERIAVRGEIFMSRTGFQAVNRERVRRNQEPFANPRNAAAGTMRQLDPDNVKGMPLDIFCYELMMTTGREPASQEDTLRLLRKWGLKTNKETRTCSSVDQIAAFRDRVAEKRDELDYEIDGIVVKVNDRSLRTTLGSRERSPRWAFAWKFPPRQERTRLVDIVVQVGRTGILTPVALLEPADIGGVTISRATLHNQEEVHRKDIRVGDLVRIERAGDVIPEVVERVPERGRKRTKPFHMPRTCPSCGEKVVREGAYHMCPAGLSCPAQLEGRLRHFASRAGCDIRTLGGKTVQQLVSREMVHDIADVFTLSAEDLMQLDLFAKKSAQSLYEQIQQAKQTPLDRFIYALGIPHVGEHMARVLARHFGDFDTLRRAGHDELSRIAEIGEESAHSISDFFANEKNKESIDRMLKHGVSPQPVRKKTSNKLAGTTIVVTGELDHFTRKQAKEEIEARGGRATSSVSDNTDYLVVGRDAGSKLDDAREHNVRTIDETQFESLLEQ